MVAFFDGVLVRAATIDEFLSEAFEPLPGQKGDADRAAQRLAAWCRSSASGDWPLFGRRLERDGWPMAAVLARFATVRRRPSAPPPAWLDDATWIDAALRVGAGAAATAPSTPPCAFEQLLAPVADAADAKLQAGLDAGAAANLTGAARASLRRLLLDQLSGL
jgi:hypothetical protein